MIRFQIGALPVRVQPTFFLIAVVLGLFPGRTPTSLLLWMGIVFASVLVHELGHALTARRFGAQVEIELFAMGGVTRWTRPEQITAGRRVLIAAAGSAVGITIGLSTWALWGDLMRTGTPPVGQAIRDVLWVNLGWGVLNWLPIRILDGGHIVSGLFEIWFPKRHEVISDVFFTASAAALAAVAVYMRLYLLAILIVVFGFSGRAARPRSRQAAVVSDAIEEAGGLLEAGEYGAAADRALRLLPQSPSPGDRARASRILVRALMASGRTEEALGLMERPPEGFDLTRAEAGTVYLAAGRLKSAVDELSAALEEDGDPSALPALTRAFGQAGAFTEAASFFERVTPSVLRSQPLLALAERAEQAGAEGEALALRRVAFALPSEP